jgi:hypothetical protein
MSEFFHGIEHPLVGMDDTREWLVAQGYRIARGNLNGLDNACNWYAFKPSAIPARECECNEGKGIQVVVKPHIIMHPSAPGGSWKSVEVDVTGEAGGVWFKMAAYSLSPETLQERLSGVEASLVAAWNALLPA